VVVSPKEERNRTSKRTGVRVERRKGKFANGWKAEALRKQEGMGNSFHNVGVHEGGQNGRDHEVENQRKGEWEVLLCAVSWAASTIGENSARGAGTRLSNRGHSRSTPSQTCTPTSGWPKRSLLGNPNSRRSGTLIYVISGLAESPDSRRHDKRN